MHRSFTPTAYDDDQPADQTRAALQDQPMRKYDWLRAHCLYTGYKDSPKVLRVGMIIHHYVNEEWGYAWPSRRTLSEELGIRETAVSQAICVLKNANAIKVHRIADLPDDIRRKMKRHSPRSRCYSLNMDWAGQVLDECGKGDKK